MQYTTIHWCLRIYVNYTFSKDWQHDKLKLVNSLQESKFRSNRRLTLKLVYSVYKVNSNLNFVLNYDLMMSYVSCLVSYSRFLLLSLRINCCMGMRCHILCSGIFKSAIYLPCIELSNSIKEKRIGRLLFIENIYKKYLKICTIKNYSNIAQEILSLLGLQAAWQCLVSKRRLFMCDVTKLYIFKLWE